MIVQAAPQPRSRPPLRDRDWHDAGALMADHGVPAQDHLVMQENLATYLSHRSSSAELLPRWQSKVERELASPFKDDEVAQRLDFLQASLLDNVRELPAYPSKIYLTGSFSRGRLGANSDLDGYATLKPEHVSAGFDSYEHRVETQGACLFPMSESRPGYNRANLMYAGASIAIDPQKLAEPGYLRQTYRHVLDHRPAQRRETSAVYEWATSKLWGEGMSAAHKREQFEGKTFKSRVMNACLSLGGTLSMAPLIGPVVCKVADMAVRQVHQEEPSVGDQLQ